MIVITKKILKYQKKNVILTFNCIHNSSLSPMRLLLSFVVLCCTVPNTWAQVKRTSLKTEVNIKLEERFIAATREKVLENYEKADTMLRKLAADAPENADVRFQWATVLYSRKRYNESLAQAQKAYELNVQNTYFGEFYAERLADKGDYKKAAQTYSSLIKVAPNEKHLYLQQGLMYVKAEDPDNAIKAFNALEAKIGVNEETTKRKHVLYSALGKKDKAIAELQRLVEKFPMTMEYRHDIADFYKNNNEPEKALAVYKEILKVAPSDSKAMFAMTRSAGMKGNETEYVNAMKGLFSRTDVSADTKIKQLVPYLEDGNISPEVLKEVVACAEILANTHPKDAQVLSLYADILYKNGKKTDALTQYKAAIAVDKKRFYPWQYVLIINTELKDFDEVLRQAEIAADYFPNQPLVYYMGGIAYFQKEKYADALTQFEQAVPMLTPKSTMRQDVNHQLARTLTALKQYEKAAAQWTLALQDNGDLDPNTKEHYGDFLYLSGKIDQAVQAWKDALKLGSRSPKLNQKINQQKLE
jgi:tetratricopeptide (TPR) repeat protein